MNADIAARAFISLFLALSVIGITGNTLLVYATVKSKRLRNACNIYIAIIAFCSIFHQLSHIVPSYLLYSRVYFFRLLDCILIQAIPNVCLNTSTFLILTIAIDRLFLVFSPLGYYRTNKSLYVKIMLIPPIVYGVGQLAFAVATAFEAPTQPVICVVVAIFSGTSALLFPYIDSSIYILVIISYLILWCKVKSKSLLHAGQLPDKMLKSVVIITCFATLNWIISVSASIVKEIFKLNTMESFCLDLAAGVTMNIDMAIHCLVFYKFSDDYRNALRSALQLSSNRQVKPFIWSAPIVNT
ncbi:hypothetical protein Tcan_00200 [Toxocara canis]|uniref:G-protein coupled receptors family 1 profile domain-containing protein n=1 Tax=Toxocara canis TaxID=6265 RepID=A0A0B2VJH6_TOXCA|nr:hypothetical protein Tcan_00200 [Toxocara canis]